MSFIPIEFQKINEKTKKDFVRIKAKRVVDRSLDLFTSKFGGIGFFPKNAEFPEYQESPMRLLAQINFAELPENSRFPKTGLLQFYLANNDEYYGMDPDGDMLQSSTDNTGFVVKYWADLNQASQITQDSQTGNIDHIVTSNTVSDSEDFFPIIGEYELVFGLEADCASISSIECAKIADQNPFELLEDISMDVNEEEQFFNNIEEYSNTNGHKLLGNAYFVNEDPRADSETGDNENNYQLLLQIDTDFNDDNDIMWGDQGIGQFFITEESFNNMDFSEVYFSWDC